MRAAGSIRSCRWTVRKRPVLAYQAGAVGDRLRSIRLFPRTSWKRNLLAQAIRLAVRCRLDGGFCSSRDRIDPLLPAEDLIALLSRTGGLAGGRDPDWLVTWPAHPARRRIYLMVRGRDANDLCVVKIGAGEFNGRQLRNEAAALNRLSGFATPFSMPSVLFEQELAGGRTALALSGFPASLCPVSARHAAAAGPEIIGYLRRTPVPAASMRLCACDWWPAFREHAPGGAAVSRLLAAAEHPIHVGGAHGDLGPGNMLEDGNGGILLFDWENASMQAPVLTDAVGLWLALRQRRVLRNPVAMRLRFRAEWTSSEEPAALAALAFLCAHGNLAAARMLEGGA